MPAAIDKEVIKQSLYKMRENMGDAYRADINIAIFVTSNALIDKKLDSGQDYANHYLHVAMTDTRDDDAKIVGILHDILEDSNWTTQDLKDVGFSDKIVKAVDSMSLHDGENYFDMIKRCSFNELGLDRKLVDLRHNMDCSRNSRIMKQKTVDKINKYMISKEYLKAVRAGKINPGSSVIEFVPLSTIFREQAGEQFDTAMRIAEKFSSVADITSYKEKTDTQSNNSNTAVNNKKSYKIVHWG